MHINYILIRSLAVQITAPCEPAACVPREPGSTLHFSSVEADRLDLHPRSVAAHTYAQVGNRSGLKEAWAGEATAEL